MLDADLTQAVTQRSLKKQLPPKEGDTEVQLYVKARADFMQCLLSSSFDI
jgi:hypothetical protein